MQRPNLKLSMIMCTVGVSVLVGPLFTFVFILVLVVYFPSVKTSIFITLTFTNLDMGSLRISLN
jgi:hypothetical protein